MQYYYKIMQYVVLSVPILHFKFKQISILTESKLTYFQFLVQMLNFVYELKLYVFINQRSFEEAAKEIQNFSNIIKKQNKECIGIG